MEEDAYKSSYNELASVRCFFEKALTNHQAKCCLARHFCLADREGYACSDDESSVKCCEFLEKLRKSSTFAFKLREVSGPLPHNMEIRVQAGGLLGLARLPGVEAPLTSLPADDISQLISRAREAYGTLQDLPYSIIIQSVVQFQGRRRRPKAR